MNSMESTYHLPLTNLCLSSWDFKIEYLTLATTKRAGFIATHDVRLWAHLELHSLACILSNILHPGLRD